MGTLEEEKQFLMDVNQISFNSKVVIISSFITSTSYISKNKSCLTKEVISLKYYMLVDQYLKI